MGMRGLRNWILRSTRQRTDRNPGDGVVLIESPELRRMLGDRLQAQTSELRLATAIDSASIVERHATGDNGEIEPNIYVTCPSLRGMFKFSPEETERRIRLAFPDLSDKAVKASIRHLADRVVLSLTSKTIPDPESRGNWVHGWADYR